MCWKQEWAAAIGNLNHAIEHVERAKAKLERRLVKNRVCLERMSRHEKACPSFLAPVRLLVAKNEAGIAECSLVIVRFKVLQDQLFGMIKVYGISKRESSERLKQLMGTYVPKEGS